VKDNLTREFLLSHHLPARYSHCVVLKIRGKPLHVCARCLGQFTAMAGAIVVFSVLSVEHLYWFSPPIQVLLYLAPMPAAVDWTVQTVTGKETTNPKRITTGALLGIAWVNLIACIVLRFWPWGVVGILSLLSYWAAMVLLVTHFKKWGDIAAQFPGLTT